MSGIEGDERLMSIAVRTFFDPVFSAERDANFGNDRPPIWDARAATFKAMEHLGMFDTTCTELTQQEQRAMNFISSKILQLTKKEE